MFIKRRKDVMTGVHGIQAGQNAKQLRHGRYSGRRTRRSERVYRVMFQAVHSPFTGLKCFIHVLATGLVLVLVECFFLLGTGTRQVARRAVYEIQYPLPTRLYEKRGS